MKIRFPYSTAREIRDVELMKGFLRYGSIRKTAIELRVSRDAVRAALDRMADLLESQAKDAPVDEESGAWSDDQVVYGLYDPETGELVYIGKTWAVQSRYANHCKDGGEKVPEMHRAWKTDLRERGLKPRMEILDRCTRKGVHRRERELIANALAEGCPLVNKVHVIKDGDWCAYVAFYDRILKSEWAKRAGCLEYVRTQRAVCAALMLSGKPL